MRRLKGANGAKILPAAKDLSKLDEVAQIPELKKHLLATNLSSFEVGHVFLIFHIIAFREYSRSMATMIYV